MGLTLNPPAATNSVRLRYTLTSSGTLSIPGVSSANPITATIVCVGGGAGGMSGMGGSFHNSISNPSFAQCFGGGSGGMGGAVVTGTTIITGDIPYVIGAGGTGGAGNSSTSIGGAGGNTTFSNILAPGGRSLGVRDGQFKNIQNLDQPLASIAAFVNSWAGTSTAMDNQAPSANALSGQGFSSDGSWMRGTYNSPDTSGSTNWARLSLFPSSHGASTSGAQANSASGQTALAGQAGSNGGTLGGGTAAVPALTGGTGFNTSNGAAASTTWAPFANAPIMVVHAGGGGGSGGSGKANGGGANAGGTGGAASTLGGAGGNGGAGGVTSGSGVANGSAGTNATGTGAGGGGGGGSASGNTASGDGGKVGGAGGNGSAGAIYIYW